MRPLRAATGCEFEAASETGRVMQTGSDLGYRATKGNLRCNLDPNILTANPHVSQIQALDRTQPGLPMKKGRCGTMTHDYKRNGTTTLFAAPSPIRSDVRKALSSDEPQALMALFQTGRLPSGCRGARRAA